MFIVHSLADVTANFNFNSVQNVQKGRTKEQEPFSCFHAYGNYRLQYRHTYALRRFTKVNMPTRTNEFNTFKLFHDAVHIA